MRVRSILRAGLFPVILALAASAATAPRVAAECDGPHPDFGEVVRTAKTIVVGVVVAVHPGGAWDPINGGLASHFTMHVEHVLRGEADDTAVVKDLASQPCSTVIGARLGDRIALAVDGTAFTNRVRANMVAWIDGVPPPEFGPDSNGRPLTYSLDEVFALAGLEPPTGVLDVAEAVPATTDAPFLAAAVGAVVLAALVAIGLARRLTRPRTVTDSGDR
jgi:hypothetical protein